MPRYHRMTAEVIIDQLSQCKPNRGNIIPPKLNTTQAIIINLL